MDCKISRTRPLRFENAEVEAINAIAVAGYPHEACGLLIGRETPDATVVERIEPARNLTVDRLGDRYLLDPDDFQAADHAARRDELDIVGIWHTHPDHPARPSSTDLVAAWPGYSYLIVSLTREGVVKHRAWCLDGGEFIEQGIEEKRDCQK